MAWQYNHNWPFGALGLNPLSPGTEISRIFTLEGEQDGKATLEMYCHSTVCLLGLPCIYKQGVFHTFLHSVSTHTSFFLHIMQHQQDDPPSYLPHCFSQLPPGLAHGSTKTRLQCSLQPGEIAHLPSPLSVVLFNYIFLDFPLITWLSSTSELRKPLFTHHQHELQSGLQKRFKVMASSLRFPSKCGVILPQRLSRRPQLSCFKPSPENVYSFPV